MDFSEEQTMNVRFVLFIFLIAALSALGGVTYAFYAANMEGKLEPELWIVPIVMISVFGSIFYMLFRTKLETSISSKGFAYRYAPFIYKERLIAFGDIVSWKINTFKNIFSYGGYGYRKNLMSKRTAIILNRKEVIEFELKDGRSIIFSTMNGYMLNSAMRKYVPEKELK